MAKLTGYILAIAGLIVIILAFNLSALKLSAISSYTAYIIIAGIVLMALGVVIILNKEKVVQAEEEVPIFHGKKIVGYRRHK